MLKENIYKGFRRVCFYSMFLVLLFSTLISMSVQATDKKLALNRLILDANVRSIGL